MKIVQWKLYHNNRLAPLRLRRRRCAPASGIDNKDTSNNNNKKKKNSNNSSGKNNNMVYY